MEVVRIKKILAWNLLIYIGLHCVNRSSWIATTLATLINVPVLDLLLLLLKLKWLQFSRKHLPIFLTRFHEARIIFPQLFSIQIIFYWILRYRYLISVNSFRSLVRKVFEYSLLDKEKILATIFWNFLSKLELVVVFG